MCQFTPWDARVWSKLFHIDQQIAEQVRLNGCQHYHDGPLHVANYPRKPRGEHRDVAIGFGVFLNSTSIDRVYHIMFRNSFQRYYPGLTEIYVTSCVDDFFD